MVYLVFWTCQWVFVHLDNPAPCESHRCYNTMTICQGIFFRYSKIVRISAGFYIQTSTIQKGFNPYIIYSSYLIFHFGDLWPSHRFYIDKIEPCTFMLCFQKRTQVRYYFFPGPRLPGSEEPREGPWRWDLLVKFWKEKPAGVFQKYDYMNIYIYIIYLHTYYLFTYIYIYISTLAYVITPGPQIVGNYQPRCLFQRCFAFFALENDSQIDGAYPGNELLLFTN